MNNTGIVALVLTAILLCAKPALAANDSGLPQTADEWVLFICLSVSMLCLVVGVSVVAVTIYLAIRGHYYIRGVIKILEQEYEFLSTEEKDTISKLEMEIDKTLDVYRPGIAKYSDAWREWSKEDGGISLMKGRMWSISWKNGYSPYGVVEYAMSKTEAAMSKEKRLKEIFDEAYKEADKERCAEKFEKARNEKEKCRRIAAMLWGIWWQAEVKRKMEGEKKYRPSYVV